MKKLLLIASMLFALPMVLLGAERVVVLEIATGTWCYYCPAAANGAEDLWEEHEGRVLIVEYHVGSSDPFQNSSAVSRYNLYSPSGVPTAWFDGIIEEGGGGHTGSKFFAYNARYNQRIQVEPPLEIELVRLTGNLYSTSGSLQATITNVSDAEVSGTAHFTVTESHIPYSWQGMESLHWVERDMLPHAYGEQITLAPGEEIVLNRDFTIDENWDYFTEDENIEFGCFVQGEDKEIYQAALLEFGEPSSVEQDHATTFELNLPPVVCADSRLELSLDEAGYVDATLYDACGSRIKTLQEGPLPSGTHGIDLETASLPAGAYFLKVSTPRHTLTRKLVVTD